MNKAHSPWWRDFYTPALAGQVLAAPRKGELAFLTKALELDQPYRLFDQCCGWGRLAFPLAELGHQVVGVDGCPTLLSLRPDRPAGVNLHQGDARRFTAKLQCDAGFNMYSSFSTSRDDQANLQMLARMAQSLKAGARVVLDTINPQRVRRFFQPLMEKQLDDGSVLVRRSQLQGDLLHQEWHHDTGAGPARRRWGLVKLYEPEVLAGMLERAGLTPLKLYGDFQGAPLKTESERLIWIAQKKR